MSEAIPYLFLIWLNDLWQMTDDGYERKPGEKASNAFVSRSIRSDIRHSPSAILFPDHLSVAAIEAGGNAKRRRVGETSLASPSARRHEAQ